MWKKWNQENEWGMISHLKIDKVIAVKKISSAATTIEFSVSKIWSRLLRYCIFMLVDLFISSDFWFSSSSDSIFSLQICTAYCLWFLTFESIENRYARNFSVCLCELRCKTYSNILFSEWSKILLFVKLCLHSNAR